ncbi:hypothetical protein E2C01_094081 [Portunus trituberculatus]|uniref:Uncharacterized protein n=1 Tax=Portunus trituberculatus TaxID=210409 RepID=A0A5B7JKS7_PORTR|nr:hypothetical protein [Portunus trituberculatus]
MMLGQVVVVVVVAVEA